MRASSIGLRLSHHTLTALRTGQRVTTRSMFAVLTNLEDLHQEQETSASEQRRWLEVARRLRDELGSGNRLADELRVSRPFLHRILNGKKALGSMLLARLRALDQSRRSC